MKAEPPVANTVKVPAAVSTSASSACTDVAGGCCQKEVSCGEETSGRDSCAAYQLNISTSDIACAVNYTAGIEADSADTSTGDVVIDSDVVAGTWGSQLNVVGRNRSINGHITGSCGDSEFFVCSGVLD